MTNFELVEEYTQFTVLAMLSCDDMEAMDKINPILALTILVFAAMGKTVKEGKLIENLKPMPINTLDEIERYIKTKLQRSEPRQAFETLHEQLKDCIAKHEIQKLINRKESK